jgi:hypothetical protein
MTPIYSHTLSVCLSVCLSVRPPCFTSTLLHIQVLLEKEGPTVALSGRQLASVQPRRGRLLVFPHACPHAGLAVQAAPKLLLRGELY